MKMTTSQRPCCPTIIYFSKSISKVHPLFIFIFFVDYFGNALRATFCYNIHVHPGSDRYYVFVLFWTLVVGSSTIFINYAVHFPFSISFRFRIHPLFLSMCLFVYPVTDFFYFTFIFERHFSVRISYIFRTGIHMFLFFLWRYGPTRAKAFSFLRFLDHTQRRITVGRTPLDEWSARRWGPYLTTHNTHNRQTSMPPVGFEPTISADERLQTYALDRAATGTGYPYITYI